MNYFYSEAGNLHIDDKSGILYCGSIGVRTEYFSKIFYNDNFNFSEEYSNRGKIASFKGLWAFFDADSTEYENKSYNPTLYSKLSDRDKESFFNKYLFLTKMFKNATFSAIPIVENREVKKELEVNIGRWKELYKKDENNHKIKFYMDTSLKRNIEVYNENSECIFTDALIPINIIGVIDEKSPLDFSNFNIKRKFRFDKNIMIIPIKLPSMIENVFGGDEFNHLRYTFTEFTIVNGDVTFNLNMYKEFKTINTEASRKVVEAQGKKYIDLTNTPIKSIYQSDLLVLVAELPEQYKRKNIIYFEGDRIENFIGYNI